MATDSGGGRLGRIVNNFAHDLTTGSWVAGLLVLWRLSESVSGMPPEAAAVVRETMGLMFWLVVVSFVIVNATGAVRTAYWRRDATPEELPTKRRALLVKHAVFLIVYVGGTIWAWTLLRGAA